MAFILGFSILFWAVVLFIVGMTAILGPGAALLLALVAWLLMSGQALYTARSSARTRMNRR